MPIRRVHRDRPFLRNRQEKNENDGPRGKRGASDGATRFTGPQRPPTAANGGTAGTGPPMYGSSPQRQVKISKNYAAAGRRNRGVSTPRSGEIRGN